MPCQGPTAATPADAGPARLIEGGRNRRMAYSMYQIESRTDIRMVIEHGIGIEIGSMAPIATVGSDPHRTGVEGLNFRSLALKLKIVLKT
ncbi:hypothetical protein EVAR_41183_1 [Eumeta japonica]|uniref:Uncharacterized protein n=1 Tax=Eumeta variegata TaxID=151549 RepID=A0A4C1WT92_EUMVA|nr:hypothetical protein EVAR_41183_1 [Eumeta japonica]